MINDKAYYIGIDPESEGAIAIINTCHKDLRIKIYQSLPQPKKRAKLFKDILDDYIAEQMPLWKIFCCIEDVHIMPGMSAQAMNSLIRSYGIWLGILASHNIEVNLVSPKTWKAYFNLRSGGKSKTEFKAMSYRLAMEIFGDIEGAKKGLMVQAGYSDKQIYDRAEALLIAEYGRQVYG